MFMYPYSVLATDEMMNGWMMTTDNGYVRICSWVSPHGRKYCVLNILYLHVYAIYSCADDWIRCVEKEKSIGNPISEWVWERHHNAPDFPNHSHAQSFNAMCNLTSMQLLCDECTRVDGASQVPCQWRKSFVISRKEPEEIKSWKEQDGMIYSWVWHKIIIILNWWSRTCTHTHNTHRTPW